MNVLVIGLGSMGKRRIRLLKKFEQVDRIVGVDAREDRRKETEEKLQIATYDSIQSAMHDNTEIQSAFICTSPLSHSSLITEMLQRNLNVFTELNLVDDGYERNIALAEKRNKTLFLSSTFFYREEINFIRRRIKEKEHLNYVYHIGQYLPDWHPWENYKEFFVGDSRTNGCREIMAIELPWLIDTFGKVSDFHVISDNISSLQIPYRDNYMIQLEHESGNKGTLIIDIVSPKAVRNLEVYGEKIYYSWNGSPTGLEYYDEKEGIVKLAQLYDNIEQIEGYSSFVVENAYQSEILDFLNVVNGKTRPKYGFKEDKEVLALIDNIEGICNE